MKKLFFAACLLMALVATVNHTTKVSVTAQTNESAFLNGNNDLAAPDVSPPVAVNTNNNVNCPTGWTRTNDAEHCIRVMTATVPTSGPPIAMNNAINNKANEKVNSGNIQSDQGDANKDVANTPPVTIVKENNTTAMAPKDDGIYEIVWSCVSNTNNVAAGFINNAEFNIRS